MAPGRFDPRLRIAADVYNLALTGAFASKDRSEVVLRGGTFPLPFEPIEVGFDPAGLRAGDRELHRFTPIAELEVYGLAMRYRWPEVRPPGDRPAVEVEAVEPVDPAAEHAPPRVDPAGLTRPRNGPPEVWDPSTR